MNQVIELRRSPSQRTAVELASGMSAVIPAIPNRPRSDRGAHRQRATMRQPADVDRSTPAVTKPAATDGNSTPTGRAGSPITTPANASNINDFRSTAKYSSHTVRTINGSVNRFGSSSAGSGTAVPDRTATNADAQRAFLRDKPASSAKVRRNGQRRKQRLGVQHRAATERLPTMISANAGDESKRIARYAPWPAGQKEPSTTLLPQPLATPLRRPQVDPDHRRYRLDWWASRRAQTKSEQGDDH